MTSLRPARQRTNTQANRPINSNVNHQIQRVVALVPGIVKIFITCLRKLCNSVFEATKKFRKDRQLIYIESIRSNVNQLANIACKYSQCTADSLNDFICGIDAYLTNNPWPRLEKFVPFCGRGTQYLSFIRKHTVRRSKDNAPGH